MKLQAISPSTGDLIEEYETHSAEELEAILSIGAQAMPSWIASSVEDRCKLVEKLAAKLKDLKQDNSELMSLEMGKPISQSFSEIEKCIWLCKYYAENAPQLLAPQEVKTEAAKSFVSFQPLGSVLGIMPWNFPFWQVIRFVVPAILSGNVAFLKHASNVPGCGLNLERLFKEAGFPEGVFQSILMGSQDIPDLIADPRISAVTLTGSTPAGRAVASCAGKYLKKTVLELGGSDPYVILEDADLDLAAQACVDSRLMNSGQSCVAAKRFIVHEKVYNSFIELCVTKMGQKKLGSPLEESTDIGPLARRDLRDHLHQQVCESIEKGAKLCLGGDLRGSSGAFYPPYCFGRCHERNACL